MSSRDKMKKQAHSLEVRIREKLDGAKELRRSKTKDKRIDIAVDFIKSKLKPEAYSGLKRKFGVNKDTKDSESLMSQPLQDTSSDG